jgi:hypothetical protein
MEWMVKKGQDLAAVSKSHATLTLHQHFWPGDNRSASCDLLATDADKPSYQSKDKASRYAFDVIQKQRVLTAHSSSTRSLP